MHSTISQSQFLSMSDTNILLMRHVFTLFLGLAVLSVAPAVAQTDCNAVKEEKGVEEYRACKRKEQANQIKEDIADYKEDIEDRKKDINRYYERMLDDVNARKDDDDRYLERREKDEKRTLEDLKDDEASKAEMDEQKAQYDQVKAERKALQKYYDIQIDILETQQNLRLLYLDQSLVVYELRKNRSNTSSNRYR